MFVSLSFLALKRQRRRQQQQRRPRIDAVDVADVERIVVRIGRIVVDVVAG